MTLSEKMDLYLRQQKEILLKLDIAETLGVIPNISPEEAANLPTIEERISLLEAIETERILGEK